MTREVTSKRIAVGVIAVGLCGYAAIICGRFALVQLSARPDEYVRWLAQEPSWLFWTPGITALAAVLLTVADVWQTRSARRDKIRVSAIVFVFNAVGVVCYWCRELWQSR